MSLLRKFAMMFLILTLGVSVAWADSVPVITTSRMPDGAMWWHYSEVISVRGTAPITWSLIEGDLPSGLSLSKDGVVSGTPRWRGTSYFTVEASNSVGYARKRLSIHISSATGIDSSSGGCNAGGFGILALAFMAVLFKKRH